MFKPIETKIKDYYYGFKGKIETRNIERFLIGDLQEKLFQLRIQEMYEEFSNGDIQEIIFPDTRARPLALAIKYTFDCIANNNSSNPPKYKFIATPKISTSDRPNLKNTKEGMGLTTIAQMLFNGNPTNWAELFIAQFGEIKYQELLHQRNQLAKRLNELQLVNHSHILIVDDFTANATTAKEIGIALKTLSSTYNINLQSIFTIQDSLYSITRDSYFTGLDKINYGYGTSFRYSRGEFDCCGYDNDRNPIYTPDPKQKAIGVVKHPNELYSLKLKNNSPEIVRNIRILRLRLRDLAKEAIDNPYDEKAKNRILKQLESELLHKSQMTKQILS